MGSELDIRELGRATPPVRCMDCESRVTYRGVSINGDRIEVRTHCNHPMTGGTMSNDCLWFTEKGTRK